MCQCQTPKITDARLVTTQRHSKLNYYMAVAKVLLGGVKIITTVLYWEVLNKIHFCYEVNKFYQNFPRMVKQERQVKMLWRNYLGSTYWRGVYWASLFPSQYLQLFFNKCAPRSLCTTQGRPPPFGLAAVKRSVAQESAVDKQEGA